MVWGMGCGSIGRGDACVAVDAQHRALCSISLTNSRLRRAATQASPLQSGQLDDSSRAFYSLFDDPGDLNRSLRPVGLNNQSCKRC
jgi:hypothetical protein